MDRTDKREAILEAALELFGELGFHGAAVPQIAERAKVGAGTIYRYFPGKEALVNELYRTWRGRLTEAIFTDYPSAAPFRAQFHHYWSRAAAFGREHRTALLFLELHHHAAYLDAQSRAAEDAMLSPVHAVLAKAAEEQVVKPLDPKVLMAVIWGAFMGVMRAAWEGRFELTPAVLDAAEGCCWEAIRR
ncbi:MAG TPA: TetR/AcrR family transcriptional regulator [Polyangiaceae bacterium]|jgi:AcrR family transcriptional regulator